MAAIQDKLLYPSIDHYIDPWLPPNRVYLLPGPIQRFLGCRTKPHVEPPVAVQWLLMFLATIAAICFVGGVFNYAPGIQKYHPPVLIASLGASAVLEYNTIRSPLAQPRNAVFGNTLSSIVGVAVSKGFQRYSSFHELEWLSGAVGCALSSVVMSMTGTVHPPGGATAVIASIDAAVIDMGWMYVALVLLASVMMQVVALLFNNTVRQYPVYWWTPEDVGSKWRKKAYASKNVDEEKAEEKPGLEKKDSIATAPESEPDSETTLHRELSGRRHSEVDGLIQISPYQLQLPEHIHLSVEELRLLQSIQKRLQGSDETS